MIVKVVNDLWITSDILFSPLDGRTQQVFRFTNTARDATVMGRAAAENVRQFVQARVPKFNDASGKQSVLEFEVEPSDSPKGLFVVHGRQEVSVESEG